MKLPNVFALIASYSIMAFFAIIRPILGPAECKYGFSCMPYARKQLKELPIYNALWRIARRVFSCSPLSAPKQDLMF